MVDELLERGTDGGPPRYTGWLEALKAVYDAAGQKVHEADWVVDAGYIGRTIQLFKDRLRGHEDKPQLTYTILEHCKKILRDNPKRFVMPTCLRWVRRRPLPNPHHTAVAIRRLGAATSWSRRPRSPSSRPSSA
jgi:hypothetical protein